MLLWAMWLTGLCFTGYKALICEEDRCILLFCSEIMRSYTNRYTNTLQTTPFHFFRHLVFFFFLVWCAVGSWCRIFTTNERLIFPNNILNLDTWIIHLNTSFVSLGMFKIFIMEIIAFLCCSLCICILKIILKLGIYISLRLVALYTFTFLFHSIFQF